MSPRACRGPRALLLEYALEDLDDLKRQRVESHLERCEACSGLLERYRSAFASARDWEPEVEEAQLERMVTRLGPYLEPEPPLRGRWGGFGWSIAVATAATAAVVFFAVDREPDPDVAVTAPAAVVEAVAPTEPPAPVRPPVRLEPARNLRIVASADWNGEVEERRRVTKVNMSRGFAVMAYAGDGKRRLEIRAHDLTIEVLGTRFYVEALPEASVVVGVVSGKVRVKGTEGARVLNAGTVAAFEQGKEVVPPAIRSVPYHADAYLDPPPRTLPRKPRKAARPKPPPKKRRIGADPTEGFVEAERLTLARRYREAARIYSKWLERDGAGALASAMRYERARLWAFRLGRAPDAVAELTVLAQGDGEIAVQAALTICELDRSDHPCASRECLERLADGGLAEARRTLQRWGLNRFDCE